MKMLRKMMDMVLPPRCMVSGQIVESGGMLAPTVWKQLDFIAEPLCVRCGFPFDFQAVSGLECSACIKEPPPFRRARSALRYGDVSRQLILAFKHGDKTHAVQTFKPWLRFAASAMLDQADFIVPVPLHRWRLLKRRYNQAAILAKFMAQDAPGRYVPDMLMRVRATPSQGHMKRSARRANVRRAFAVDARWAAAVKGKTVLLVDDVYTTGATISECARALVDAGAAHVDVVTLARVVQSGGGYAP